MKNPLILLKFFIPFILACTNPFSTREPEQPDAGGVQFIPPRTPEVVLQNLKNAVLEQNIENYLRNLSDPARNPRDFAFIPDQSVATENPGVFDTWARENERFYFSQLRAFVPNDSLRLLTFRNVQTTISADSAVFIENYTLRVHHTRQSQEIPALFAGQARFFMNTDNIGDWSIHRWEDLPSDSGQSWSRLKAFFGN